MKKCLNCGIDNENNATICYRCGAKLKDNPAINKNQYQQTYQTNNQQPNHQNNKENNTTKPKDKTKNKNKWYDKIRHKTKPKQKQQTSKKTKTNKNKEQNYQNQENYQNKQFRESTIYNGPERYSMGDQFKNMAKDQVKKTIENNYNPLYIIIGLLISIVIGYFTKRFDWSLVLGSIVTGSLITGSTKYPIINGSILGFIYGIITFFINLYLSTNLSHFGPLNFIGSFINTVLGQIFVGIIFVLLGWYIRKKIDTRQI